ncbi:MAG: AraC family transcriptional regulator [Labilithrix sp.]|nr:AraC family transcriptional regulator [Labilithrix sp.]
MGANPRKLAAARFLRALLDAGERLGVDRTQALAAIGVSAEESEDPSGWIPAFRMTRAWEIVPEMSGDPCFGLHAAEATPLGVFGPLDLATMSSATVGDALERMARYYETLGAMSRAHAHREPDGAMRLSLELQIERTERLRHYVENFFAIVVTRMKMASLAAARDEIDVSLRFAHRAPPALEEHARVFGPRVRFASGADEIVVGAKTATLPLVTANPELSAMLEREGERLALRPDAPIVDRVRSAIEQAMREGAVGLDDVAKKLGVGPRTIQRQLQSDGTSFADVLDAVRRDVALKTLADGGAAASELAYVLGFSQPSAFYRAFRRWTGTTPSEYKAQPAESAPEKGNKRRPR